ncbi:MAG TPA: hypothetical protein VH165_05460 [Kofleriaceae bacterium]|nr:hypothetical protein [Kofleriaceae bacterium]
MRWSFGAQAILTARCWDQSAPFNEVWALLATHYHAEVFILASIIPFSPPKPPRRTRGAG